LLAILLLPLIFHPMVDGGGEEVLTAGMNMSSKT
jgi:hypothetical protein